MLGGLTYYGDYATLKANKSSITIYMRAHFAIVRFDGGGALSIWRDPCGREE